MASWTAPLSSPSVIDARFIAAVMRQPLAVHSLMYHDVIEQEDYKSSGFPDSHSQLYKLTRDDFALHLEAIRHARRRSEAKAKSRNSFVLTFDDGGGSAFSHVAPLLEALGWRGHFFIATDWIGKTGFLNAEQILDLDRRGHVIGTHSCTHPARMSHISRDRLLFEWSTSIRLLEKILGHPVSVASVPGGFYSRKVGEAAAEAGIVALFNSEPTSTIHFVNTCCVLGRYAIHRKMRPGWSGGLSVGHSNFRLKQMLSWKVKGIAKAIGGDIYLRLQKHLFSAGEN